MRPALKNGLTYARRSDGLYVGRRESGLIYKDEQAAAIIPLLNGKYTIQEIALLVDLPGSDVKEIVNQLEQARMLDHQPISKSAGENRAELQLLAYQDGVVDSGRSALQARARHRIDIYGCGLIGANLARILASSGVGELRLIDPGNITSEHLPVTSLANVGVNAAKDLQNAISRDYPRVLARKIKKPTLVIATRHPTPHEILTWMRHSINHLVIDQRGDSVELGPLVIPGKSSCLRCLNLERLDRDPNWYAVELCAQNGHEPPAALAQLGAGLAALTALSLLDGPDETADQALIEATLRIDHRLSITTAERRRHPRCGCAWS